MNYYYVALDRANGSTRVGEVVAGTGFAAANALKTYRWPGGASYKLNTPFAISVQMNFTGLFVWVRQPVLYSDDAKTRLFCLYGLIPEMPPTLLDFMLSLHCAVGNCMQGSTL